MANNYKSLNQQVWGEGGLGYAGEVAQVKAEQDRIKNDPARGQAYTQEEVKDLYGAAGITDTGTSSQKAQAMPWAEGAAAGVDLKPTSDPDYGYVEGTPRPVKEGDSGADEAFMTDADYQLVQHYKSEWNRYNELAKQETDPVKKQEYLAMRDQQNEHANRVRLRYGYSGGADGSMYLTGGQLGLDNQRPEGGDHYGAGGNAGGVSGAGGTSSDLKSLLDTWQQAAMQQSDGQIDYAVAKAVAELQRALADAQPQFKEQAESVDRDARQAMDNSALYAELRGDKGGIGQEQYNSIRNTQAQNHLAVQHAQTKLATDTQRQIADLRAQGEFEKADAALAITQTYLTQLISLEQWAAEYNLSVEQFNASLAQWTAEYDLSMQKLQTSQNQWQAEFDYDKQLNSQNQLASMGTALLNAGVMPGAEHLAAMGITAEQASEALWRQQLTAAQGDKGKNEHFDIALEEARKKGNPISALKYLKSMVDKGYLSDEECSEIYYLYLGYEDIIGKDLPLSVNPGLVAK